MRVRDFFVEPFHFNRETRKGMLLHVRGDNGRASSVEISPLPGYSKESFEEAKSQLQGIEHAITRAHWSLDGITALSQMNLAASVYFALETALLDLIDPVDDSGEDINSYALLLGSPDEMLARAQNLEEEGQTQVKIKLGHLLPSSAHAIVDALKERFQIRLDFNRKWTGEQTAIFCSHYPEDQFIYLEEPCQDPNELLNFPFPFALDETLRDNPVQNNLFSAKKLKALILKPTLHYPLTPFLNRGLPCVVTSSFESQIGIGQLRRLITRLGLQKTTHGMTPATSYEVSHRLSALSTR